MKKQLENQLDRFKNWINLSHSKRKINEIKVIINEIKVISEKRPEYPFKGDIQINPSLYVEIYIDDVLIYKKNIPNTINENKLIKEILDETMLFGFLYIWNLAIKRDEEFNKF